MATGLGGVKAVNTYTHWPHICQAADVLSQCHGSAGSRTGSYRRQRSVFLFFFSSPCLLSGLWRIGSLMVELTYIFWELHWRHRGVSYQHTRTHLQYVYSKDVWLINMHRNVESCQRSLSSLITSPKTVKSAQRPEHEKTHLCFKNQCVCLRAQSLQPCPLHRSSLQFAVCCFLVPTQF